MSAWKALTGRISLLANLATAPPAGSVLALYQQAWGSSPQNFQEAPNPLMPATAQGVVLGMQASCTTFPNRVDFNLSPNTSGPPTPNLRLIEHAGGLRNELARIAGSFGSGKINVPGGFNRVAMFVQFADIEPTVVAANQAIVRVIPEQYRIQLSNEEAFILQVGRSMNIAGLSKAMLNFITKWSVEQFHVVSFGLAMGGFPGGPQQTGIVPPQVTIHLGGCISFDCATAPTQEQLLPSEQSMALLEALRQVEQAQREYELNVEGFQSDRTTH